MIPTAAITAWRHHAPWPLPEQIEQDLVLSRALVELFTSPVIQDHLLFRGGTALHKLYFRPPARYSEDLDFVQAHAGPIGPVLTAIRGALDPWLGHAKYKAGEGRATLLYRFVSEGAEAVPMRLKIEINTREHFAILPTARVPFAVDNPWFSGSATLPTFALEELLATKLRALYQRRKGRDVLDLDLALTHLPELDLDVLVRGFQTYMEFGRTPVSRAEFEANLAGKRAQPDFLDDVQPLLRPGAATWNGTTALDRILTTVIARLPGDPWAGDAA